MAITFQAGYELGPNDLHIYFRDQYGNLFDPPAVTYSIYDMVDVGQYQTGIRTLSPNGFPVLIQPASQPAIKFGPGAYYATWPGLPCIPGVRSGPYEIRWMWNYPGGQPTEKRIPFTIVQFGTCGPSNPSTSGF